MTVAEAIHAMRAGERVCFTVAPGHVMHVWAADGCVYQEAQPGAWSAGVVEAVCAIDSDFLHEYFAGRELGLVARTR